MGYVSKTTEELDEVAAELDVLEQQVVRVLRPFGVRQMTGPDISSRYLTIESPGGNWSIKIRVSDHENTSNLRGDEPDVNLTTDYEYTDENVWKKIRRAFWKNVA